MTARLVLFGLLAVVAAAAAVLSFSALRDLALLCGFAPRAGVAAAGRRRRRGRGRVAGLARRPRPRPGPPVRPHPGPDPARAVGGGQRARPRPGRLPACARVVGRRRSSPPSPRPCSAPSSTSPCSSAARSLEVRQDDATDVEPELLDEHGLSRRWETPRPPPSTDRRHRTDRRRSRAPSAVSRAGRHRVRGPPPDRRRPAHPDPTRRPTPPCSPEPRHELVHPARVRPRRRRGLRSPGAAAPVSSPSGSAPSRSCLPSTLSARRLVGARPARRPGRAVALAPPRPHLRHRRPLGRAHPPQGRCRVDDRHRARRRERAPCAAAPGTVRPSLADGPLGAVGPDLRGRPTSPCCCAGPGCSRCGRRSRTSSASSAARAPASRSGSPGASWTPSGAVLVTSTRTDLYELTAPLRARLGPVYVFNPVGLAGLDSTITFDPLTGCASPVTAAERATDLLAAGAMSGGAGEREFWESQARRVLTALLHAAALGTALTMRDVQRWVADPDDAQREVPRCCASRRRRRCGGRPAVPHDQRPHPLVDHLDDHARARVAAPTTPPRPPRPGRAPAGPGSTSPSCWPPAPRSTCSAPRRPRPRRWCRR